MPAMCTLGKTDLRVSNIGLGAARLALPKRDRQAVGGRSADRSESRRILEGAYRRGCRLVDTADAYGLGQSEHAIGAWVRRHPARTDCVIVTKIGWNFYNAWLAADTLALLSRANLPRELLRQSNGLLPFDHGQNFSAEYLEFAATRSAERLHRSPLEVLLLHIPPLELLKDSGWDDTLRSLCSRGYLTYYGVSVRRPIEAFAAMSSGKPDVLEVPWSPYPDAVWRDVVATAKQQGVGVIGRSVLAGGMLPRPWRSEGLRPTTTGRNKHVERLVRNALRLGLQAGSVDALVVGARRTQQLSAIFDDDQWTSVLDDEGEESLRSFYATRMRRDEPLNQEPDRYRDIAAYLEWRKSKCISQP